VRRAVARVNVAAIERNSAALAAVAAPAQLCAVVKADGYGHGAVAAARAAQSGGATWLAVATAEEAVGLRAGGVTGPLLVLGALSSEELGVALAAGADVVAWRVGFVDELASRMPHGRVGVHVKLDTGMGRLGTRDAREATAVAEAVDVASGLRLAGVMTHFATSDEDDPAFMHAQIAAFEPWAERMREGRPELVVHAANSAAALREPRARFDMVRCGIAIYGMDPFGRDPSAHGLEPALSLESYVAEIKRAERGQSSGYGRRHVAKDARWIGTLPIGYGDGLRRAHTNNLEVLVSGRRAPLVGTVSMDNISVDLGPAEGTDARAERGEPAVVIGHQGSDRILAEELAARIGTINYEITCGLTARVPREHHRDGAPAAGHPPVAGVPDRP
jgi:alanine racemase